jgi:hypothetical protein
MSWSLQAVGSESCETTLRGRQRSSIHSLATIPRITSAPSFAADDSAVSDKAIVIENNESSCAVTTPRSQSAATPSLSPLLDAHVSDYFISTAVPRHKTSVPILPSAEILSPTVSLQLNSVSSRGPSSGNPINLSANLSSPSAGSPELLKLRLSSGFFAYFLCGWGDGGEINFFFATTG